MLEVTGIFHITLCWGRNQSPETLSDLPGSQSLFSRTTGSSPGLGSVSKQLILYSSLRWYGSLLATEQILCVFAYSKFRDITWRIRDHPGSYFHYGNWQMPQTRKFSIPENELNTYQNIKRHLGGFCFSSCCSQSLLIRFYFFKIRANTADLLVFFNRGNL